MLPLLAPNQSFFNIYQRILLNKQLKVLLQFFLMSGSLFNIGYITKIVPRYQKSSIFASQNTIETNFFYLSKLDYFICFAFANPLFKQYQISDVLNIDMPYCILKKYLHVTLMSVPTIATVAFYIPRRMSRTLVK